MIALVRLSNGYKQQVNISSKNMRMCSQPSPIKSSGVLKMCIYFRMSVQLPGVLSKQIPHLHSLRFSSYLGNHPMREQRWKNLTSLCVWAAAWMGMWRGMRGISKKSEKHTPHSKILMQQPKTSDIWSSVLSHPRSCS